MFSIPSSKVAVEDRSAQRLLELLGERVAVRYMKTEWAHLPCFQYLVEEGEVAAMEPAWGGDAAKRASQIQQVGALFQFSASKHSKSIAITASANPGPLQRAEWVEFMSFFFNKEAEAMQVFEGIQDRYLCPRKQVSEHSAKPVVAWAYYSSWSKEWVITNAAYKHYYLRDAGAQLVGSTNTDMKFNTPSGLHAAMANVDILIDETYSAGAYTFSKALGNPRNRHRKGEGGLGAGMPCILLCTVCAQTEGGRGGWGDTAKTPGGRGPTQPGTGTVQGRVGWGRGCCANCLA